MYLSEAKYINNKSQKTFSSIIFQDSGESYICVWIEVKKDELFIFFSSLRIIFLEKDK